MNLILNFGFLCGYLYTFTKFKMILHCLILELEHDFVLAVPELHGAVVASGEIAVSDQGVSSVS